jgi:DNA-binding NtrC family response regulator
MQSTIESGDVLLPSQVPASYEQSFHEAKSRVVTEFEKNYIHGLLIASHGNISKAAKAAQKNRRAFWELIRKYKIDIQNFKSNSL